MTEISTLIEALDEAAKPDLNTRVIQLDAGGIDIRKLQERLNKTFNNSNQKQPQQNGQQPPGDPQQRGGEGNNPAGQWAAPGR